MKIIILSILCGILLLISVILLIQNHKLKKDAKALCESINEFTNQGKATQISLYDNDFARLQNAVGDLEELINLEKGKLYNENKKNVQFISDISHQLKTPIAALRLYCEMDLASGENTHAQKELELIDKTEQLIYKLLKLEKVKLDTYYMNFEQNDLNEICQKLILDFKPLFKDKNFELNGTSIIRCDREWLYEALSNIIKNACEHTDDKGNIKITITNSERSATIELEDDGGGMKEEEIPKLFTRFYKAESSAKSSTGIGLAISKAIIERHHGLITAQNKNNGLCVTICLPKIEGYEAL